MALSTDRLGWLDFDALRAPGRLGWPHLAALRAPGRPCWLDLAALCAPGRPGWFDLVALRSPGRPAWLDLAALRAPDRPDGSIWLQTIAPTLSFSTARLDAACLVRSGTSPHASNLVYIYIY